MMIDDQNRTGRRLRLLTLAVMILSLSSLSAQTYSYLPSGSTTDDRFLSVAGGAIQTLGENPLYFKLASLSNAASIEIGIFDGDTYGVFDQGTVPLIYTLYADPEGDCTGTVLVKEWRGDTMPNNAWFTATVSNTAAAQCQGSDYFYMLKVRSSDPAAFHWSSFKLRTDGTIAVKRGCNLSFSAPLASATDATVVYPNYPVLVPTNYNGEWRFHVDVPVAIGSLTIWDGDFDRGSYDCSDNDTDDDDTPNTVPAWATGSVVAEGTAASSVGCQDAAGNPTGGTTTSSPPDDSRSSVFARTGGISYEVIAPDDAHYANTNPSGNLEWEQFNISTETFNRNTMDLHADTLPAGSYEVVVSGMDLSSLNALRFPYDVAGVDVDGNAVTPIHPDYTNGSISGTIYYETGGNCTKGFLEVGIPLASVELTVDYNDDGITDDSWSTTGNLLGQFSFSNLHPGDYTVTVDFGLLPLGAFVVCDSDGAATPNVVEGTLGMCSRSLSPVFGYGLSEGNGLLGANEPK